MKFADLVIKSVQALSGATVKSINSAQDYSYELEQADQYRMTRIDSGELESDQLYQLGDINHDHKVSIADAIILQKHLLAIQPLKESQGFLSDMDGNQCINAADLTLLKRVLLN